MYSVKLFLFLVFIMTVGAFDCPTPIPSPDAPETTEDQLWKDLNVENCMKEYADDYSNIAFVTFVSQWKAYAGRLCLAKGMQKISSSLTVKRISKLESIVPTISNVVSGVFYLFKEEDTKAYIYQQMPSLNSSIICGLGVKSEQTWKAIMVSDDRMKEFIDIKITEIKLYIKHLAKAIENSFEVVDEKLENDLLPNLKQELEEMKFFTLVKVPILTLEAAFYDKMSYNSMDTMTVACDKNDLLTILLTMNNLLKEDGITTLIKEDPNAASIYNALYDTYFNYLLKAAYYYFECKNSQDSSEIMIAAAQHIMEKMDDAFDAIALKTNVTTFGYIDMPGNSGTVYRQKISVLVP